MYPETRLKRLRRTAAIRNLLRETRLTAVNLIQPYFISEGRKKEKDAGEMIPGIARLSIEQVVQDIAAIYDHGVRA
ncbi:MAG: porphobilinogen synthase, partial [Candidatus Omnitrophica bacterium]|nr:porphobilinogen synthase [Candidatus Omnitrophota bacterium]